MKPCENKFYIEKLIKINLKKPFKLGKSSLNRVKFTVTKVEDSNYVYELLPSGNKIKVISKSSTETYETAEILTFCSTPTSQFIYPKFLKINFQLFGLDDIEKNVIKYLDKESNAAICLHGPRGNGKALLTEKLEDICEDKKFFYLDKFRLQCDESELSKVLYSIEQTKNRRKVLVIDDIDKYNDDCVDMFPFSKKLEQLLEDKTVDVKILMIAEHVQSIYGSIEKLIKYYIHVPLLNDTDRMSFVKQLINKTVGREIFEEGFEELIENLRGYSASDLEKFIDAAHFKFPELRLEQLMECLRNDDYADIIPINIQQCVKHIEPLYWSDIGGYEDVKLQLKKKFQLPLKHGLAIPKGVLLHGPPGCSKTMFARAFATECQLKLISITPSSVMRGIVGESEAALRSYISQALELAPSIIFIDEIDTLIPKRTLKIKPSVGEHLLTEIITFLDGIDTKKNQKVILMGATNRLDCVDEALIRPGRMNLLIKVGLPDQESRKSILKIVFSDQNYKIEKDIIERIPDIAKLLENKSGAEIVDVGRRIKKLSERKKAGDSIPTITVEHISEILPDFHYLIDKMNSLSL